MSMAPCACLSPILAVPVDPGMRLSAFARSKGEGGGPGEEWSPPAWCPRWCLLTIPCLTRAEPFPRALWGKRLGGLGFVF